MTETERNSKFYHYEPILGHPGTSAWSVFKHRLQALFFVDLPSKSTVWATVMTWMVWKLLVQGKIVSDVVAIGLIGLMAISWLNWCLRQYVGPVIESICMWISSGKVGLPKSIVAPSTPGKPASDG